MAKAATLGGSVAGGATEAEAGVSGGGVDLGCGEVVTFGDAEGGVVVAQDGVGGLGEERWVTEFEGDGDVAEGGNFEEGGEAGEVVVVGFEVGRELEEEQAEASGGDGGEGSEEVGDVGLAVAEALDVGDALREL